MFSTIAIPDRSSRVLCNAAAMRLEVPYGVQRDPISDQANLNQRWRPALMAFFLRRVRNHAEAEDMTQEVFVRLLHADAQSQAPDAYVFKVAANLVSDRARRMRVRLDYRDAVAGHEDRHVEPLDPHRIASGRAQLAALTAALDSLPERTRTIFMLYRVENMSQQIIADTFGMTPSGVKMHVAKAMARLMAYQRDAQ